MDNEIKLHEKYYHFAVAELPRVRAALEAFQSTGLDWLDAILRMQIVSTIEGFEDTIRDFEFIPLP